MPILAKYEYALAAGHDVPLANLNTIETHIGQQNRKAPGGKLYPVGIRSGVLDLFPVRTMLASGAMRGDGFVTHAWDMTLCTYGVRFLLNTYLSNLTAVSNPVTIYTRRHELASYARYNAYLTLPDPKAGDIVYLRQNVFTVRLQFTHLIAL